MSGDADTSRPTSSAWVSIRRQAHLITGLVKSLHELDDVCFSSGDAILSPLESQSLSLFLRGSAVPIAFPLDTEEKIEDAMKLLRSLEAANPATFGLGKEELLDESVRRATKVLSADFALNVDVFARGLLEEIGMTMMPQARSIIAERYSLEVYAHGGHFKAHIDTPRSNTMFGTLVICLPTAFTGGQLQLRERTSDLPILAEFDWGATMSSRADRLQWCAFYSDVIHQIASVETGARMTIVYNLCTESGDACVRVYAVVKSNPFSIVLKEALDDERFMPEGGIIATGFKYDYAHASESFDPITVAYALKGVDRSIHSACTVLGLKTRFVNMADLSMQSWWDPSYYFESEADAEYDREPELQVAKWKFYVLSHFGQMFEEGYGGSEDNENYKLLIEAAKESGERRRVFDDDFAVWIRPLDWKTAADLGIVEGNQPELEVVYSSLAMLITVPKWSERDPRSNSAREMSSRKRSALSTAE